MGHHFVLEDWIFLISFYFFKWSKLLTIIFIFGNARAPHCSFYLDLLNDLRINSLRKDLTPKTKPCSKSCKTPHWSFNLQNGNAFGDYGNSSLTLSHTYHYLGNVYEPCNAFISFLIRLSYFALNLIASSKLRWQHSPSFEKEVNVLIDT
jgi:hypothetical protein